MSDSPRPAARILNFGIFQVTWFVAVLGAASGRIVPALGTVLVAAAITLAESRDRQRTLVVMLMAAFVGLAVDGVNLATGVFSSGLGGIRALDAWLLILVLWLNFGLTLRSSLGHLQGRVVLSAVLGALFAPLSYLAGARLGALELGDHALYWIAAEWFFVCPLLTFLARDRSPS